MSASFRIDGLDELKAELRDLPQQLAGEARHIIEGAANRAVTDIKSKYGDVKHLTGNLRDHVSQEELSGDGLGVDIKVLSSAPHAWLFEYGSQARHYYTKAGVLHETGIMPGTPAFVPAMEKNRLAMWEAIRDLLERAGLEVTGDADVA
jgi:hypothetical protein